MCEGKNVLIVDDEAGVREALIRGIQRKFNKESQQVVISEAVNGQEALELANTFPPDLILMDIRMPVMNGLKACSILRRDAKFAATKIIMLTCEIMEEGAGLLSGADEYIIKPFDIKTLLIRIERGLFNFETIKKVAYINDNGFLSKECFLATCLHSEVARAKRYQHSLSFLLFKVDENSVAKLDEDCEADISKLLTRRQSDKLVKWSYDTFALLLLETNAADATLLAKRIAFQFEKHPKLQRPFVGIANLEDTLADNLITNAESSLDLAVRTGEIVLNRCEV